MPADQITPGDRWQRGDAFADDPDITPLYRRLCAVGSLSGDEIDAFRRGDPIVFDDEALLKAANMDDMIDVTQGGLRGRRVAAALFRLVYQREQTIYAVIRRAAQDGYEARQLNPAYEVYLAGPHVEPVGGIEGKLKRYAAEHYEQLLLERGPTVLSMRASEPLMAGSTYAVVISEMERLAAGDGRSLRTEFLDDIGLLVYV
jgi:hypothetical protein